MQRKVLNRPALPGHPDCEQEEPEYRAGPTERVQADADDAAVLRALDRRRRRRRLVALLLLRLVPVALVLQPAQAAAGAAVGQQGQAAHSQAVVGCGLEAATGGGRGRVDFRGGGGGAAAAAGSVGGDARNDVALAPGRAVNGEFRIGESCISNLSEFSDPLSCEQIWSRPDLMDLLMSFVVRVIRGGGGSAVAGTAEGAAGRADDGAADGHGRHEPAEHEPGTSGG